MAPAQQSVDSSSKSTTFIPRLPLGVWAIGTSNLLLNVSTAMVYSISAVFLTTVLGASSTLFGFIDGFVEALALSMRVGSGWTSDHLRKRKPLLYIGYGMAIVSRLLMALASTVGIFFSARVLDRLSNGLQAAPRDALVGDIVKKDVKGAAFGLRCTLSVLGSLIGPALVVWLMMASGDDYHLIFLLSALPALAGLLCLFWLVKEPPVSQEDAMKKRERLSLTLLRQLWRTRTGFWSLVVLGGVFMLSRFSEGFMFLRMADLGVNATWIPTVMLIMNGFNALAAYPMGIVSDKFDRRYLLCGSLLFLVGADLVLALTPTWQLGFMGVALWGLQMGATQSLFMGMVLEYAPDKKFRALAFGVFYCVGGACHFIANLMAGLLADTYGAGAPFFYSGVFAMVTIVGAICLPRSST